MQYLKSSAVNRAHCSSADNTPIRITMSFLNLFYQNIYKKLHHKQLVLNNEEHKLFIEMCLLCQHLYIVDNHVKTA